MSDDIVTTLRECAKDSRASEGDYYADQFATGAEVFDCAANEIESLRAEIARLREERRWIPVTERLPEDAQWVLALVPAYYGSQEARWLDGHWRDHFGMVGRPVTHWQPLPPPPGEREVEG